MATRKVAGGGGGQGPGNEKGKLRFRVPFQAFMELLGQRLRLPNLVKEGDGRIKEFSYTFKTFGQAGVILDKRRTFKRALRSSIGTGTYNPAKGQLDVHIRRRDRRFKVPQREEKPRYKAVCFYMGDISYSTYGERLEMEKTPRQLHPPLARLQLRGRQRRAPLLRPRHGSP